MQQWLPAALIALTAACGSTGVVKTALHGDLASLKAEVGRARARGELDRSTVEKLARAVAGREVRSAQGDSARSRIDQVRPCARSLVPVLRDRASHADDAGAEAAVVLLEVGDLKPGALVTKYAEARAGGWRAVGARAAMAPGFAELRRKLLLDPDERVRRAAVAAELVSPVADNLESLLETARLDPDPQIRSSATEAVGALGGQRAVLALKDHWGRADDLTRTSIVRAWAMPASLRAGGREELLGTAEQPSGVASVVAALALARLSGHDAVRGRALLAYFIEHGADEQKSEAIVECPLDDADVLAAVRKTADGRDRPSQVLALARLTELPRERAGALGKLRQLGRGSDRVATQARVALAAAGDDSVSVRFRADLVSRRARERKLAAIGLYWLGDAASAALALADDDPAVRTEVACSMLARRDARH